MDQVLAYELVNKAYIQQMQQPNYPAIMPIQQAPFPGNSFQPSFSNQLPAMVMPAIISAASIQENDLCPKCLTSAPNIIRREPGKLTYRWCCLLTFVGACCVPFFFDECLDVHHICSNCQYQKRVIPATYR